MIENKLNENDLIKAYAHGTMPVKEILSQLRSLKKDQAADLIEILEKE